MFVHIKIEYLYALAHHPSIPHHYKWSADLIPAKVKHPCTNTEVHPNQILQ